MRIKTIEKIIQLSKPHGWVLEPEAKKCLAAARIPVPRFDVFRKKSEALRFAEKLGFPVVAKIVSPAVVHKSDVGGVRPGIRGKDELAAVFDQFARYEQFSGVLVEEMLTGIELMVGGKVDPQFGPVVLLGMGGIAVEIYKDVAIMMGPLSRQDARAMLNRLRGAPILFGFRGQAPIDSEALIDMIVAFSGLLSKISTYVSSVDLNPVMCSPQGCVVADARMILRS